MSCCLAAHKPCMHTVGKAEKTCKFCCAGQVAKGPCSMCSVHAGARALSMNVFSVGFQAWPAVMAALVGLTGCGPPKPALFSARQGIITAGSHAPAARRQLAALTTPGPHFAS